MKHIKTTKRKTTKRTPTLHGKTPLSLADELRSTFETKRDEKLQIVTDFAENNPGFDDHTSEVIAIMELGVRDLDAAYRIAKKLKKLIEPHSELTRLRRKSE